MLWGGERLSRSWRMFRAPSGFSICRVVSGGRSLNSTWMGAAGGQLRARGADGCMHARWGEQRVRESPQILPSQILLRGSPKRTEQHQGGEKAELGMPRDKGGSRTSREDPYGTGRQGMCSGGHPSSPLQGGDTGAGLTSRGSCSCQLPLCRRRKRRRTTKAVSAAVRQRFGEHLIAPGQPAEAWGRKKQMRAQHDPRTGTAGTRQCPQPLLLPPSCTEQAGPVPSPRIPGSCQQPPLPLPSHVPCLE